MKEKQVDYPAKVIRGDGKKQFEYIREDRVVRYIVAKYLLKISNAIFKRRY